MLTWYAPIVTPQPKSRIHACKERRTASGADVNVPNAGLYLVLPNTLTTKNHGSYNILTAGSPLSCVTNYLSACIIAASTGPPPCTMPSVSRTPSSPPPTSKSTKAPSPRKPSLPLPTLHLKDLTKLLPRIIRPSTPTCSSYSLVSTEIVSPACVLTAFSVTSNLSRYLPNISRVCEFSAAIELNPIVVIGR